MMKGHSKVSGTIKPVHHGKITWREAACLAAAQQAVS